MIPPSSHHPHWGNEEAGRNRTLENEKDRVLKFSHYFITAEKETETTTAMFSSGTCEEKV